MAEPSEDTPGPEDAQTGSTEPPDCYPGVPIELAKEGPCGVDLEAWTRPVGSAVLVQAMCTHHTAFLPAASEQRPFCACRMRRTRLPGDDRPWLEGTDEVEMYPGFQGLTCSVRGRTPSSCLYCGSEFPGCSIDDPNSCGAACTELASRFDAEQRQSFSAHVRRLSCGDDYSCEFVTEIGGSCYASNPVLPELPALDCALSDEQLLERKGEAYSPCPEPPVVACTTASDCSRGLACNDAGKCVSCYDGCYAEEYGGCARCSDEELCVAAFCMPRENTQCATRLDCEQGSDCVLSGMDLTGGRGNAQTRSLCQAMVTPG